MASDLPHPDDAAGSLLLQVSDAMVQNFKTLFGRGPTRARSYWAGPNALTCFLEETLTPAERNMVTMGQHQRLRETRDFFQYATVPEFVRPVEQITGRKVRSFQSSVDTHVDGLATETFIFWPEGEDGPSRADLADA